MIEEKEKGKYEEVVKKYFSLIRDLRAGKEEAVGKLVELWDEDGVFEFAGAPPVNGVYRGRTAIHVLYSNRAKASGMPIRLETKTGKSLETTLGVVDTEVNRVRFMDGKVAVAWTTVIGTKDGKGFQVAGSHAFTFKEGKIASLKIVVSPKAEPAANLKVEDLAINDIGRLALAAWPVV